MENELTAAITAKTAAHTELAVARDALRQAKRGYRIASTKLRNRFDNDAEWTARLKADLEEAAAEVEEARQRLADAVTLMQRAAELVQPFLKKDQQNESRY